MRIMPATNADTCINVSRDLRGLRSGITSKSNKGETQVTYILDLNLTEVTEQIWLLNLWDAFRNDLKPTLDKQSDSIPPYYFL